MYLKKKININIASIFITLTELNNETHYVAKKKKKKPQKNLKQKQKKPNQTCSDIRFALSM